MLAGAALAAPRGTTFEAALGEQVLRPAVAAALSPLIEAGLAATCGVIEFELGWATRSGAEFDELRADRDADYEWLAIHDEDWRRALEVQAALWRTGRMRAIGFPDLLVAAVAERERVILLRYDSHHEHIAVVTGQPIRWGSAPRYRPLETAARLPLNGENARRRGGR